MYRYTTPSFTLKLQGIDFSLVQVFRVTFRQCQTQVVKEYLKTDENFSLENNTLQVALTQQETALFGAGRVAIQLRVKFQDGTVAASNITHCYIKQTLDEEVI